MLDDGQGELIQPSGFLDAGNQPVSVAIADLNGDNNADLVTANNSGNNISIFFGHGNGTFFPRVQIPVNSNPIFVGVGDFNGDSKRDLLVTHESSSSAVVLLGDGAGNFSATAAPAQPILKEVTIADFNQDGKPVTDRNFTGKYRIMYFGYTFCPDVCPVDVQNIGAAMRVLEAKDPAIAARVVPIFVTVDPARDTPAVLKAFVGAFHPRLVGLTGSPEAIARTAREYAVYYEKGDVTPGGGYMVAHARVAYLMDPQGKPVALLPQEQSPDAIATEIRRWVR